MRKFDPAIAAEAYDWDDRIDIGSGIEVTLVAARHWSARNLSTGTISAVHESVTGRLNWLFSPSVLSSRVMRDNHMNPAEAVASFDRTCQSVAEFAAMRNACIGPNKKRVAAVVSR